MEIEKFGTRIFNNQEINLDEDSIENLVKIRDLIEKNIKDIQKNI